MTLIIDIAGAVLGLFIMANPFDIPNMIVRIIGVVLVVNAVLAFYSLVCGCSEISFICWKLRWTIISMTRRKKDIPKIWDILFYRFRHRSDCYLVAST